MGAFQAAIVCERTGGLDRDASDARSLRVDKRVGGTSWSGWAV